MSSRQEQRTDGAPVPPQASPYWAFYDEVASRQLAEWLPPTPVRVLDLTADDALTGQLVAAGHEVVCVRQDRTLPGVDGRGRALAVVADVRELSWVQAGSVDLVVAASGALSTCLAAEITLGQVHDVLRPGGRLLLVVDSLVLGLARLADQGRWAELVDVPQADVVLVPDEHGELSRCFRPEELAAALSGSGLEVDWVRPRSVLTPATVERAVEQGGKAALRSLVRTELALACERGGEAGLHLVASARRPG